MRLTPRYGNVYMNVVDSKKTAGTLPARLEKVTKEPLPFDEHLVARIISLNAKNNFDMPYHLIGHSTSEPEKAKSAVVVSCPHAGRNYPDNLVAVSIAKLEAMRDLEDFAVDKLLSGLDNTAIGGINNNIARAYLDVNRPKDAIDPRMFKEPITSAKQSGKVLAGYGLLPRLTGARAPIHANLLPAHEVPKRISLVYQPYHNQLKKLLDQAVKEHSYYMLLDCHSMPAKDQYNKALPDIILGDCNGQSLNPKIGKQIEDHIRASGFSLAWNTPYSGGFITSHYGVAASSGQSLQLEVNRSLYMTEPHRLDSNGTKRVTKLFTSLATYLDEIMSSSF